MVSQQKEDSEPFKKQETGDCIVTGRHVRWELQSKLLNIKWQNKVTDSHDGLSDLTGRFNINIPAETSCLLLTIGSGLHFKYNTS